MNARRFSEAMGELDNRYIEEALRYRRRSGGWTRWGTLAACFCLAVGAVLAAPKLMQPSGVSTPQPEHSAVSLQSTQPSQPPQPPKSSEAGTPEPRPSSADSAPAGDEAGKHKGENIAIDEAMTMEEARRSQPFGGYLPAEAPKGFTPETIQRYQDENDNYLYGLWTKGEGSFDEISWRVSWYDESMADRVTSVDDTRNYDLSLYPFPLADSVPEELFGIVDHPIFRIGELTQEAVSRRAYSFSESGDSGEIRMSFGVCYGDVVVEVTTKGVAAEWVYEQLVEIAGESK